MKLSKRINIHTLRCGQPQPYADHEELLRVEFLNVHYDGSLVRSEEPEESLIEKARNLVFTQPKENHPFVPRIDNILMTHPGIVEVLIVTPYTG